MSKFEAIVNEIAKAENIVILNHVNMDGDAVGSAFSFASALRAMGKRAEVVMDEEVPAYLVPFCDEYATKSDDTFDLAVCVDCGGMERLGSRAPLFSGARNRIVIDHHKSNGGFGDVNYIRAEASSTCEIMYELITELTGTITPRQAEQLYVGILTDTGSFRFANTTEESFLYSADLLRRGADVNRISIAVYESESLGKLKLKCRALSSLELHGDGKVASIVLTKKDFEETGTSQPDCEGFPGIARGVEGVEAAMCITALDNVKVSLRSKNYVDVSLIAAKFGGGGHVRASGFTLPPDTDVDELKETLIRLLCEATA